MTNFLLTGPQFFFFFTSPLMLLRSNFGPDDTLHQSQFDCSTVRLFGLFGKVQNVCSIYITEGFSYLKLFSPTLLTIHLCISKHTVIQGNSIFFIWCVLTLRGRKQFHSKSWRCMRVIIAVLNFAQACAEVRIKPERLHLSHVTMPIHSYIAFVSIIPKQ